MEKNDQIDRMTQYLEQLHQQLADSKDDIQKTQKGYDEKLSKKADQTFVESEMKDRKEVDDEQQKLIELLVYGSEIVFKGTVGILILAKTSKPTI